MLDKGINPLEVRKHIEVEDGKFELEYEYQSLRGKKTPKRVAAIGQWLPYQSLRGKKTQPEMTRDEYLDLQYQSLRGKKTR